MAHTVHLDQFEGPLDLLLFFIRRDELDIYDIPIAALTDEFLTYVRAIEHLDLDGASEFMYMASLLISIKAKMLLPRPELDEEGEPIDPRAELVERLLEYVRYKEAAQALASVQAQRADQFVRGEAVQRLTPADDVQPVQPATMYELVEALRRILTAADLEAPPVHAVTVTEYTVEQQRGYLVERLEGGHDGSFRGLVRGHGKPFIIATFLAVLELARLAVVTISIGSDGDDFYLGLIQE
ncbi:MAG: segregation/condensation protein A [Bacteroidota bacterium]